MKHKQVLFAALVLVAVLAPISAFAQTADSADEQLKSVFDKAVSEGAGIAAVSGFTAGALLPVIIVIGKQVKYAAEKASGKKNTPDAEPFDWSQFVVTIVAGTLVGYVGNLIGLPTGVDTGTAFMFLLAYMKIIHPLIKNAVKKLGK